MSRLKRLLQELHQRSVWQALAVYLGASYAVLEAAAYFRDEFGLPDWLPPVALVLLLIGLPVVVVTALTRPEVYGDEVPSQDAEAAAAEDRRLRFLTWRTAAASFVSALALWGLVAAGWVAVYGVPTRSIWAGSVAVLPFANMSGDTSNEYFSDGITDDIITHLSKIADLKVISRQSSMQYKGSHKSLKEIAEELDVDAILEGGVQKVGDRIRINAQLIDAATDDHLWADTYDESLTAKMVFAIQTAIAERIAVALKAELAPEEGERIATQPTENLEAYDHYILGRAHQWRGAATLGVEALGLWDSAIAQYERAVELDPEFSIAWAALATVRTSVGFVFSSYRTEEEDYNRAEQALAQAANLAPESFETHMAGAWYALMRGETARAMRHLNAAETLRPNDSELVYGIGTTLIFQGKWDDGLSYFEKLAELSPQHAAAIMPLARTYGELRRFEEAVRYADRAIALDPSTGGAHRVKFFAYLWGYGDTVMARVFAEQYPDRKGWQALLHYVRRDYKRALDIRRQDTPGAWQRSLSSLYLSGRLEEARAFADTIRRELVKTSGESRTATERSFYRAKLGLANAFAGEIEVAVREATAALDLYPEATDEQNRELMVANVYRTYILAGEYEAAIDQLEFLLSTPSTFTMARLRLDPFYEPLRDHPRFQALLDKYE